MILSEQNENHELQLPMAAEHLVPHRPPMLLIESFTAKDGDYSSATAVMPENGIFYDLEEGVEEIIVEIIAQSMAATQGYKVLMGEQPQKDGMIAGIDYFTLHTIPEPGAKLEIEVHLEMVFEPISVCHGKVFCDGVLCAEGRLKVWESENK